MKRTIIIIIFITIGLSCFGCSSANSSNSGIKTSTEVMDNTNTLVLDNVNTTGLTSKIIHVTLRYPKDWILYYSEDQLGIQQYEGENGTFTIGAAGNGKSVDEYTKEYIKDLKNNPLYNGVKMEVTSLKVDKQEARLIVFSKDVVENGDATLFVEYPKKIVINRFSHEGGTIWANAFELDGDKNHIMQIAKTIKFIK